VIRRHHLEGETLPLVEALMEIETDDIAMRDWIPPAAAADYPVVRTQVALLLADQPQRMAEVLRTIEGLPEPGQEPDAGSVVTRELLTRRLPRTQHITLG
jgi:hypothetical protein